MKLIIRHDDFDFRLAPVLYEEIHKWFISRGLTETAVIQLTQNGNIPTYPEYLLRYIRSSPNWDIQLHGWEHANYGKMTYNEIYKDLAASHYMIRKLFGREPTIWFPPWNSRNEDMETEARQFGVTINNKTYDIGKFIREMKENTYTGHSFYFHGWNHNEMDQLNEALDLAEAYEHR